MADDLDATLGEIAAERAVMAPQIRGMELMLSDARVSAEMRADVQIARDARMHRDSLCGAAMAALNALKDDGYPNLPGVPLQNSVLAEMKEEIDDHAAVVAVFVQQPAIAISPTPTFTPQPAPANPGP